MQLKMIHIGRRRKIKFNQRFATSTLPRKSSAWASAETREFSDGSHLGFNSIIVVAGKFSPRTAAVLVCEARILHPASSKAFLTLKYFLPFATRFEDSTKARRIVWETSGVCFLELGVAGCLGFSSGVMLAVDKAICEIFVIVLLK